MSLELVHFVEWKKVAEPDVGKTLNDLKTWGVKSIVAHPCWGLRSEQESGYWNCIRTVVQNTGLAAPACHAYWGGQYDICPEDPAELERIVPLHQRFLERLTDFQVRTYTMHIGMMDHGATRWATIRNAVESLLPTARKCKIILALENGQENCETHQELADFVASFQDSCVGVCFDTGHANCYGDRDWKRSLNILAPHIVTCHMHDNAGTFDDHNPPGEGNLDWKALTSALKSLPRILHAETESGNWSRKSWNTFMQVWE